MKAGPSKTVKISTDALRWLKIIAATRAENLWQTLEAIIKTEYARTVK